MSKKCKGKRRKGKKRRKEVDDVRREKRKGNKKEVDKKFARASCCMHARRRKEPAKGKKMIDRTEKLNMFYLVEKPKIKKRSGKIRTCSEYYQKVTRYHYTTPLKYLSTTGKNWI